MRATLLAALVAALTAITIAGPALDAAASPTVAASPAVGAAPVTASSTSSTAPPPYSGRENFAIVTLKPDSEHARVFAKGAFHAVGELDRGQVSTAAFPHGRVLYRHRVISTTVSDPNLRTCQFTESQTGTFRVVRATGAYAGIHYSGTYRTTIKAQLQRGTQSGCGNMIVAFHELTYFKGDVS
jgi:hypothetical protein